MSNDAGKQGHAPYFCKLRPLWQLDAYRLLREDACVRFARQAVAPTVQGFHIAFPATQVSVGLQVKVISCRMAGQPLIDLLYQPDHDVLVLDVAMAVLEALCNAVVAGRPFPYFSLAYRLVKGPRIVLQEHLSRSSLLTRTERHELGRLVWRYVTTPNPHRSLVHGDLQPSHLIVDPATATIGLIDLEALHVGNPADNLGQLFTGYHYADAALGRSLYQRCQQRFPDLFDHRFDDDLRTVVALRGYRHVKVAQRGGNTELVLKARSLLAGVLGATSFTEFCLEGRNE